MEYRKEYLNPKKVNSKTFVHLPIFKPYFVYISPFSNPICGMTSDMLLLLLFMDMYEQSHLNTIRHSSIIPHAFSQLYFLILERDFYLDHR